MALIIYLITSKCFLSLPGSSQQVLDFPYDPCKREREIERSLTGSPYKLPFTPRNTGPISQGPLLVYHDVFRPFKNVLTLNTQLPKIWKHFGYSNVIEQNTHTDS